MNSILQSPALPKEKTFEAVMYGGAPPSKELAAEVRKRWPKAGLSVLPLVIDSADGKAGYKGTG